MTDRKPSIIEQARSEGYREGVSTISQVAYDEAHEAGRRAGYLEVTLGRGWYWFAGLVSGAGAMQIWSVFQ